MSLQNPEDEAFSGSNAPPADATGLSKEQSKLEEELIPVGEMIQSTHLIGQDAMQLAGYALTHNWSLLVDNTKRHNGGVDPDAFEDEKKESSDVEKSPARINTRQNRNGTWPKAEENQTNKNEIAFESTNSGGEAYDYAPDEDEAVVRSPPREKNSVVAKKRTTSTETSERAHKDMLAKKTASKMEQELIPIEDLFRSTHLIGAEAAELIQSAVRTSLKPCMTSSCTSPGKDCVQDEGIELMEDNMFLARENSLVTTLGTENQDLPQPLQQREEMLRQETVDTAEVHQASGIVKSRKDQLMSNLGLIRRSNKNGNVQDHHIIESNSVEVVHNTVTSPRGDAPKKQANAEMKERKSPSSVNRRAEAARNFIMNTFSKSNRQEQTPNESEPEENNPIKIVQPKPQKAKRENKKTKAIKAEDGRPKRITRTYVNIPPPSPSLETKASQETLSTENTHGSNLATLPPTVHSPDAPDDELMAQNKSVNNNESRKRSKETFRILRVIKPERDESHQQKRTSCKDRSQSPRKQRQQKRSTSPDAHVDRHDTDEEREAPSTSTWSRATPRRQTLRMSNRNKSLTQKPARSNQHEI